MSIGILPLFRTFLALPLALLAGIGASWAQSGGDVRILPGKTEIEITGTLALGISQKFAALLATAPNVRLVRLGSSGGMLSEAMLIQGAIKARELDTAVRTACESACTIAYLGGRRRFATPGARFGFHRAGSAPGEIGAADFMVRGFYAQAGLTEDFIERVMSTPVTQVWHPDMKTLRRAGVVTQIEAGERR
jgi:hypothetical protein